MRKRYLAAFILASVVFVGAGGKVGFGEAHSGCFRKIKDSRRVHFLLAGWDFNLGFRPHVEIKRGKVSWYGKPFHGRRMANGKIYNMYNPTVVAIPPRSYPFGTKIFLCNPKNGRTIRLTVSDTGSFQAKYGRALDVSRAAAVKLGFKDEGVVEMEYIVFDIPKKRKRRR